jgi:ankyrin repeat protein
VNNGATPLCLASQNGHCNVFEVLVRGGVDVKQADNDGATPLFVAS